jgi:S-adenosylmethionine hydrolase
LSTRIAGDIVISIVTLTTDFGTRDGFTAQMKGIILGICPEVRIVDVTHDIEPYSILEGALVLNGIRKYFPPTAVHIGVIDPGVGSQRRGLAVRTGTGYYVGPDNGLFTFILLESTDVEVREICNPEFMLPDPHPTFHGRDIFAPAAAHLSAGKIFEDVGPLVENPIALTVPKPVRNASGIEGEAIYTDRFGNITTNVPGDLLDRTVREIRIAGTRIPKLSRYFAEVPRHEPVALVNSFGLLEIAVNGGNASTQLHIETGDKIQVLW